MEPDNALKLVLDAQEQFGRQLTELSGQFARVDERLAGFMRHSDARSDKHSGKLDDTVREAAQAVARLNKLETMIDAFVRAVDKRSDDHSTQISKAAADALAANSRLDRWQSKVDLVTLVASIIGVSGIATLVSALLKGSGK